MIIPHPARATIAVICVAASLNGARAQTPDWNDDRRLCGELADKTSGLVVVYPPYSDVDSAAMPLSDGRRYLRVGKAPLPWLAEARFIFIPGPNVTMRPGNEAVWNVRTETVETPAAEAPAFPRFQVRYVTLWRPGIRTNCAKDAPLEQFGDNNRHVTLYEFAQHHTIDPADNLSRSPKIYKYLHMPLDPDCRQSTDDEKVSGPDRWDAYGFEKIPNDSRLVRTIFRDPNSARARDSIGVGDELRAAYTMEFTIVTGQDRTVPACFGFTVPVPVQRNFFGFVDTHGEWHPYRTKIRLRRMPGGGVQSLEVRWKPR
ncbi:hypothetical protein SSBR45G_62960 [Bradyrhizobium sp. SSBR45G]|uniref:hypothetical protein n=1 Tax=unclassified Bradyrhizobium TaxID=2631580 RepID=UPI002342A6BC|nr:MULTISPECIES: hypothetical protein [unclassified Bradyrhizobium]GLH81387.1 hypothetical protein SSBR45G_62960 [Bradyrhizobium sp. SSBR45G]GLH85907.1 hypothetical protein SSBR45R_33670 [Bradyrhizobium sp. SSBR45R]